MGSFCKRKPSQDSAGNQATSQSTGAANAGMAASMDGSQENYENLNAFEKAAQDLKMDLGIIPKDNQYFLNLEKRNQASQDALADMKDNKNDKPKAVVEEVVDEVVEETTDDDTDDTDDTTVLDPVTDTALDTVEEISDVTFNNDTNDNITNYFDNTATSAVNTAAGIDTNIASALTTSVGEAEDEAISYMKSGTASNVVNAGGAQGLLAGDDEDEFDPFNRRKTLIGA